MQNHFEIAAGTITGRDHVISGRNNQDAYFIYTSDNYLIAVAADGCGEGKHSEVGAQLGIRFFTEAIIRNYGAKINFWEYVLHDVLDSLRKLVQEMGKNFSGTVNDYFLFTIIGLLLDDHDVWFFSIGDGIFFINEKKIQIGPFPNNAPPYLSYGLLETSLRYLQPELLKIQLHKIMPTEHLNSCLIGTDGIADLEVTAERNIPGKQELVGPISQFWTEDLFFTNRDMVRRRLALINRKSVKPDWENKRVARGAELLPDDTTLIVLRRKS